MPQPGGTLTAARDEAFVSGVIKGRVDTEHFKPDRILMDLGVPNLATKRARSSAASRGARAS